MTEQQLQQGIDRARPGPVQGLWDRLCQHTGLDAHMLAHCLNDWQAVAVFPDGFAGQKTRLLGSDEQTTWVQVGDNTYLLVDDPWSPEAMRRLDATGRADVQLALALPGQRSQWGEGPHTDGLVAGGSTASVVPAPSGPGGGSVVDFVDVAIARAYAEGASDIHFETSRRGIQVKYRLDGVMATGSTWDDASKSEEVISRIKVLGQLDITERRRPQDGRIRWRNAQGQGVDLRVSIMPSIFGEDAVLRLLDKAQLRHEDTTISLDLLGFSAKLATRVRSLASRPHGMLLVTGPTGSGKTTTVYAALSEVNDGLEKIVTIEDPVEYELPGVLQIPVNEQKGLTFATGLRSILRHDPDKILVGEIRDAETAQIAVQSALTGHVVFTTVHANSLLDVLGRFKHFGIEPFALASALNGVVVQRLLRRCCPHCMAWRTLTEQERQRLEQEALPCPHQVPSVEGCDHCRNTGYRGRFVLAEVHTLTDAVRDMMVSQESMTAFKSLLYGDGKERLAHQAIEVVAAGHTSIEEVRRVVGLG
jgi:general secretion pathway protein E